jgi:hypothetical protein
MFIEAELMTLSLSGLGGWPSRHDSTPRRRDYILDYVEHEYLINSFCYLMNHDVMFA